MFCLKCGVELPEDSQFCRKCGRAQTVSTGGGAAAAVAPARVPTPAVVHQPKSGAVKWILGLLLFFALCWAVQLAVNVSHVPTVAQQQQPIPQLRRLFMSTPAFTVRQLAASDYKFTVPVGASNVAMKGHFAATGGLGNDIEVFVVTEDEFVNWQNGHPTKALYNSGRVTQDSINLNLPADAGTYYVVFNNKFSFLSPKAVVANIDLTFYAL